MDNYMFSIIIAVVCLIAMFIFAIFIKRNQHYKIGGTMHIDTSRDEKDICLFTLEMPIEDIKKERVILIRVDADSRLKEWER